MKSARKHDLQTNELAAALTGAIEKAKPHSKLIGYVALGAGILLFFVVVLPLLHGRGSSNPSADAFFVARASGSTQALSGFLKEYGASAQAPAARLLLADRLLGEAVQGDPKSNPATLLADAKELYGPLAESSSPTLAPLAKVGLAMVTLQEGDLEKGTPAQKEANLEKGRAALKEVIEKYPNSLAAAKASANLDMLAGYKPYELSNEPADEPKVKAEAVPETKTETKAETKAPDAVTPAPEAKAEAPKPDATPAETPKP
jgi:hypothetical protein